MKNVYLLLGSFSLCQGMLARFLEFSVVESTWNRRTALTTWQSTSAEHFSILCHKDPNCNMFRHANSTGTVPGSESPRVILRMVANQSTPKQISVYIANDFASAGNYTMAEPESFSKPTHPIQQKGRFFQLLIDRN